MKITGIAASDGISIGKVFRLEKVEFEIPSNSVIDIDNDLNIFKKALVQSTDEIEIIRLKTLKNLDEDHAMIFEAHKQIVNDPEIEKQVNDLVRKENYNVVHAYDVVTESFALIFESMDNDYMKERAADVRDVKKRVICHMLGIELNDPNSIDEEVIVVADDLTPSDTAQLDRNLVKGFITNIGGRTSHSAIMARSLEIAAVVGTKDVLEKAKNGELMILNGMEGYAITNPTVDEIEFHKDLYVKHKQNIEIWNRFKDKETITKDGVTVELAANIGSPEDVESALDNGAEGIGLYRTEFLYMNNNDFPTEDEQFIAYKMVLEKMQDKKVVIRTLDIGGDKHLDYLPMEEEMNPFLGHRALRLCLDKPKLFKTQLRALLRSSNYGNLHIMFPMVATLGELRKAKNLLNECKNELIEEGTPISNNYKVGIMVEIPSVAILADRFAKEVDFFSIGTNDLIQYSFAADRMNQKVSYLYQPYNPSLLRLIKMVIDASHDAGIWTGMCGEMAGDQIAAPILLGLGLDEFSMSATSILRTRHLFDQLSQSSMNEMALKALNMDTNQDVKNLVEGYLK